MTPGEYLAESGFVPYYPLLALSALIVAYLCGSIPVALIVGRLVGKIDIREHGSGNTGTTNVLRVLGWKPGLVVLALDMLKGALGCLLMLLALNEVSTMISQFITENLVEEGAFIFYVYDVVATGPLHDIPLALAILACIAGHMYSPFMRFKGGKGVATAFGSLVVVMPFVALTALAVFIVMALITRIVSVGSIVAALSLPVCVLVYQIDSVTYFTLVVLAAFVLVVSHRKNMVRLVQGEEPRFSVGKLKKDPPEQ